MDVLVRLAAVLVASVAIGVSIGAVLHMVRRDWNKGKRFFLLLFAITFLVLIGGALLHLLGVIKSLLL